MHDEVHHIIYKTTFCIGGRINTQLFLEQLIGDRLNAHTDFCVFWPGALSARHACRAIVALDLYTRNRFSESVGSRFGGPGQKALPAMNEFTLLWIFA